MIESCSYQLRTTCRSPGNLLIVAENTWWSLGSLPIYYVSPRGCSNAASLSPHDLHNNVLPTATLHIIQLYLTQHTYYTHFLLCKFGRLSFPSTSHYHSSLWWTWISQISLTIVLWLPWDFTEAIFSDNQYFNYRPRSHEVIRRYVADCLSIYISYVYIRTVS